MLSFIQKGLSEGRVQFTFLLPSVLRMKTNQNNQTHEISQN